MRESWIEDKELNEAYQFGFEEGKSMGYLDGFDRGYEKGFEDGQQGNYNSMPVD